jgi:alpha-ribazole phosphatase
MGSDELILVRHTRVAAAAGVCYGRLDVPLVDAAAQDIAAALAVLPRCRRVYSSPAARCLALARRVAARDGAPLELRRELLELDFGRWEGLRWDDVPRAELDAWAADPWGYAPGGGESAESLRRRVHDWFDALTQQSAAADDAVRSPQFARGAATDRRPVTLIVAHQGPLRAVLERALRLPRSVLFELPIPFGAAGVRRLVSSGGHWRECDGQVAG